MQSGFEIVGVIARSQGLIQVKYVRNCRELHIFILVLGSTLKCVLQPALWTAFDHNMEKIDAATCPDWYKALISQAIKEVNAIMEYGVARERQK